MYVFCHSRGSTTLASHESCWRGSGIGERVEPVHECTGHRLVPGISAMLLLQPEGEEASDTSILHRLQVGIPTWQVVLQHRGGDDSHAILPHSVGQTVAQQQIRACCSAPPNQAHTYQLILKTIHEHRCQFMFINSLTCNAEPLHCQVRPKFAKGYARSRRTPSRVGWEICSW